MPQFQNPQDPGTERRLLIAFALTFAVLLISQPLLMKFVKQPPAKQEQTQPQKQGPQPAQPTVPAQQQPAQPAPAASKAPAAAAKRKSATAPAVETKQAQSEQETVVDSGTYHVVFTNRGAQVKSWILKQYDDDAGKPLDLVNQKAAAQFGYPLSLWTYDEGLRKKLADALYVATSSDVEKNGHTYRVLTFEYAGDGITARKQLTFDLTPFQSTKATPAPGDRFLVGVEAAVTQNGSPVAAYPAWPSGFGDQATPASYASAHVVYETGDNKVTRDAAKKVSGGATLTVPFNWGGVGDSYFGAVFIPADPAKTAMVTFHNSVEIPREPNNPNTQKDTYPVLGAAVGNTTGTTSERMFVGPKNLGVLESVNIGNGDLRQLINFGFWSFISRPLFLWLRWQQHYTPNWGVSIIVLTIIINVVLFPLRLTSMKSALKMQKLQPQMNAIKEKYKQKQKNLPARDPRKLELNQQQNQEIAALFKREGANPVGGCLPMLIQFPFLIAFYAMLESAIELRHAHFLWMNDLSSADPYHILPIGIILSTLFVQKMTPQAGMDPAQQKMMTFIMPIMLGVISWNLSAGLNLYWVAGNLIMIIQQYFMNRSALGREIATEAAKRAAKKR